MSERLQAAIERLARGPHRTAKRLKMPTAVERVGRFPMSWQPPPSPERVAQVSVKMANWLGRGGTPLDAAMLDDVPVVIAQSQTTFLRDERFRRTLSSHLENEVQPRALLRLIDAYFQADSESIHFLGRLIEPHVSRHAETADLTQAVRLGLFDPGRLADGLTSRIIAANGDVDRALVDFGQAMSEGASPFATRALAPIPDRLADLVANGRLSETNVLFSALRNLEERGIYDPENRNGELVASMLRPYLDGSYPPHSKALRETALHLLGDPLETTDSWSEIDFEFQRLIVAWSPRRTVELAFTLTRETDDLSKWKREFWIGLVDQGVIDEATLVLSGPLTDDVDQPAHYPFARFVASSGASIYSTAILLMRSGGVTMAQWTPSGSCRVWFPGNEGAPPLRRRHYDISQTRVSVDYEQAHRGSKKGVWQAELLSVLATAGLNVSKPERLI